MPKKEKANKEVKKIRSRRFPERISPPLVAARWKNHIDEQAPEQGQTQGVQKGFAPLLGSSTHLDLGQLGLGNLFPFPNQDIPFFDLEKNRANLGNRLADPVLGFGFIKG